MADKEAQVDWDDDGFLDVDECCERIQWLHVRIGQLRRELHDERVRCDEWEKMYYQATADTEVERLQAELARTYSVNTELCADLTLAEVRLNKARQYNEGLEHRIEILNQLLDNSVVELAQVHQAARDQSDEVQELWLSPCEAEGLKRQLAKAERHAKALDRECDKWHNDWLSVRARLLSAEDLGALVTPRLAEVLERLAWIAKVGKYPVAARHGRELATRIREVLDDSQA